MHIDKESYDIGVIDQPSELLVGACGDIPSSPVGDVPHRRDDRSTGTDLWNPPTNDLDQSPAITCRDPDFKGRSNSLARNRCKRVTGEIQILRMKQFGDIHGDTCRAIQPKKSFRCNVRPHQGQIRRYDDHCVWRELQTYKGICAR
jgi:hypothetical protein